MIEAAIPKISDSRQQLLSEQKKAFRCMMRRKAFIFIFIVFSLSVCYTLNEIAQNYRMEENLFCV